MRWQGAVVSLKRWAVGALESGVPAGNVVSMRGNRAGLHKAHRKEPGESAR